MNIGGKLKLRSRSPSPFPLLLLFVIIFFLFLCCQFSYRGMMQHTFLLVTSFFVGSQSLCDVPPTQWCTNDVSMTKCRVTEQCKEWKTYSQRNAPPVAVAVYYESQCSDSIKFIVKHLGPAYDRLSKTGIMNVTLVPYGNARESKNASGWWDFSCQHGEVECRGNILQTCAIHYLKSQDIYLPYIRCIMDRTEKGDLPDLAAKTCAEQDWATSKVDYSLLSHCASAGLGNRLEHEMAQKTQQLNPRHKFVPWITVFGVHTSQIQKQAKSNLVQLVCDSYKGVKPSVCTSVNSTTESP